MEQKQMEDAARAICAADGMPWEEIEYTAQKATYLRHARAVLELTAQQATPRASGTQEPQAALVEKIAKALCAAYGYEWAAMSTIDKEEFMSAATAALSVALAAVRSIGEEVVFEHGSANFTFVLAEVERRLLKGGAR